MKGSRRDAVEIVGPARKKLPVNEIALDQAIIAMVNGDRGKAMKEYRKFYRIPT
jgi:hypothetical protein